MLDEIFYGVIPRNVGPDGFRSVTAKLAGWHDLGVTALWISPVNTTPPGNFGYAVTDYFRLRDDVGSQEDFRELVQAAHDRGIRVLMDFVPNHTSDQHPYFQDARDRGTESPHYDFYDRDERGEPTHYFSWTDLPNLNFDNDEVERWITEAFCHWVREFDVDGFRVDVAWGIRQRRPDFWPRLSRAVRELKPDALLLAEASARDAYYVEHGFDAAYDWTDELGHWAWEQVFDDPEQLVPRLHAALTNEGRGFADERRVFRFLNNNDTAARFVTRYGVDMTRVATAMLLTLPGVPCVYVGDEVGAEFEPYRDAGPISWEDRHGLRPHHRRLIRLRRAMPSLRGPGWHPVELDGSAQLYGYVRSLQGGGDPVLVLLNFSGNRAEARPALPAAFRDLTRRSLTDHLTDEPIAAPADGALTINLEPWSARILA
ncbi:alpha-amylase family glycosyl hydrolase [Lysobacter korlensis]|uniref:Alpha-amylase family glycosyl hydrolase n=1 Tax=Lysobacter korlensis TaxID=553636 RepID=A0ABV6RVU5_9GAMM